MRRTWVTVQIDRPMGSVHPKHPDIVYPINYGYVPGIMGGDGEEQDAYILGVDYPLNPQSLCWLGRGDHSPQG